MSKHTPGPYEIEEILNASHSNHQRFWSYGVKAGKTRIAVCCDVPGIKENAHLFAAAPETAAERDRLKEVNAELLAALQSIESGLPAGSTLIDGANPLWRDAYRDLQRIARAAIAKATGGENV